MKEKETKEKVITDNRRYAYIRVSSKEQNWNRQIDLVRNFVSQIVLEILSFVAEQERINIKERQREGLEAAKRRGIRFGRSPKEITQIVEVIRQYQSKEVSLDKICADYQISRATFYQLKKKWEEENRKGNSNLMIWDSLFY